MTESMDRTSEYEEGSLSLVGAIALGTGVMIGAGIFALTGQMAEMTGRLFPLAFLSAALMVSFSAYSYVKMSRAYPSAGGIGMYLQKAYGPTLSIDRFPCVADVFLHGDRPELPGENLRFLHAITVRHGGSLAVRADAGDPIDLARQSHEHLAWQTGRKEGRCQMIILAM